MLALSDMERSGSLDTKAIAGRTPWRRLRVGDWRVLYRPLDAHERARLAALRGEVLAEGTPYIERIVNRRDLERIIAALP